MKKSLLMLALLLPLPAIADSVKIGVIDTMRLSSEYSKITGLDEKLQSRLSASRKELEDMAKTIEEEDKKLKANEVMMTESKSKKAKESLVEKYKLYREKEATLNKELQSMRNQELTIFRDAVRDVTSKFAKDEKYTLIMQSDGIVYSDDSYDITDQITARLKAALTKK